MFGGLVIRPLYDINSLLPYERDVLNSRKLAMSVGGQNKWPMMRLSHWQKAAEETNYPVAEMDEHLRDILCRAPEVAQAVRHQCRDAGLKTPVLTRLASAIAKRAAEVRRLYGF